MPRSRSAKRLALVLLILSLLSSPLVYYLLKFRATRGLAVLRTVSETTIDEAGGRKETYVDTNCPLAFVPLSCLQRVSRF